MNPLFKTISLYLLASILAVIAQPYIYQALIILHNFYIYTNNLLAPIFNEAGLGNMIHHVLVLITIPAVIITPFAVIYKVVQKRSMPYTMQLIWALWIIMILTSVLLK